MITPSFSLVAFAGTINPIIGKRQRVRAPGACGIDRRGDRQGADPRIRALALSARWPARSSRPAACSMHGFPPRPVIRDGGAPWGLVRHIVTKLSALFAVDAFAGGFIIQSMLALWLFERYGLSLQQAAAKSSSRRGCSARSRFSWPRASPSASA